MWVLSDLHTSDIREKQNNPTVFIRAANPVILDPKEDINEVTDEV